MKTDAYTRIVLTVLACTLIVFVIHVFGSEAVYGQLVGQDRPGVMIVYICNPLYYPRWRALERVDAQGEREHRRVERFCLQIENGKMKSSSQGNT